MPFIHYAYPGRITFTMGFRTHPLNLHEPKGDLYDARPLTVLPSRHLLCKLGNTLAIAHTLSAAETFL